MAIPSAVVEIRPHEEELAAVVHGDGAFDKIVQPVAVGGQALAPSRTAGRGVRAEGLHAVIVRDFHWRRPTGDLAAVLAGRAGDNHVLVETGSRRIAIAKGDVDGPILGDDRMRALVLVTGIRIRFAT